MVKTIGYMCNVKTVGYVCIQLIVDKGLFTSYSLVPRPSITANVVEGVVKLLRRMTSGGRLEVWLIALRIH